MKPNSSGRLQPYDTLGQYASPRGSGWTETSGQGRGRGTSLLSMGGGVLEEDAPEQPGPRQNQGRRKSLLFMDLHGAGEERGEISESEVFGPADHKGRLPKKPEVRDENLDQHISDRYEEISEVFARHKVPLLVTSANDSDYGEGSLHYEDKAIDLRGNHISKDTLRELAAELQQKLGKDYDVLAEEKYKLNDRKEWIDVSHIHIEYDPKSRRK